MERSFNSSYTPEIAEEVKNCDTCKDTSATLKHLDSLSAKDTRTRNKIDDVYGLVANKWRDHYDMDHLKKNSFDVFLRKNYPSIKP
jgi:hypothetical protein